MNTITKAAKDTIRTLAVLRHDRRARRDWAYRLAGVAGYQTSNPTRVIDVADSPRITALIDRSLDEARTIYRLASMGGPDQIGAYFGRFPGETTEAEIVGRLELLAEYGADCD